MRRHLLVFVLITWVCGIGVAKANLIPNPSFEDPGQWRINHRDTDSEIERDTTRAFSGSASMRLTNKQGDAGNVFQVITLDEPLPPGSVVRYGGMSATEDAGGPPRIMVYLQHAGGERWTLLTHGTGGTHDFEEVAGSYATDEYVFGFFIFYAHYAGGSAWWDDTWLHVERAEQPMVGDRPQPTEQPRSLKTPRGLTITLNDAGEFTRVQIDETDLCSKDIPSGLWLDVGEGDLLPVAGGLRARGDDVSQFARLEDHQLSVLSRWSADEDGIRCRGRIVDRGTQDRGVDLYVTLPVGDEDWHWWDSVTRRIQVQHGILRDLTFSAASGPGGGLSLSVPADSPADCEFGIRPDLGYYLRFRLGLSQAGEGALRGRAPFEFTIRRIDPDWGLRDAARRYQEANPRAFRKHAEREGLWLFGKPSFELPDPENYAFHEGGPEGWEYDDRHGIYTFPYIIPGQRSIRGLDSLPESSAEAMRIFEDWTPEADAPGAERGWSNKEIIRNCMLHDADGNPHVVVRKKNLGGNSVIFPLNANPELFEGTGRATVGNKLLEYVSQLQSDVPQIDGIYVDSLAAWGAFSNYRREHFADAQIPLSHDPATGQPIIPNRFALLEFLWELGDVLHADNRLLFANGFQPSILFHAYAVDVLGAEGGSDLAQKRTLAGPKPFAILTYDIHDDPGKMEDHFNRCVQWGIWPSFGHMSVFKSAEQYGPVAELNNRYVPALRAITTAGWHPVTHARAPGGVLLERWGSDGGGAIYLTVFTEKDTEATIRVDTDALGLPADFRARDLLGGEKFEAGGGDVKVPLEARRVRVLRLQAG